MANMLDRERIENEVTSADRLAKRIDRPRGVHGIRIESDQDHDGNPMLVVSVDLDDDLNPSDERLDELIDYEDKIARTIRESGAISWPLVRLVPRT